MANIELVIKIPEEIYKSSQVLDVKHEDVIQIPLEVIANGTPLPKGHGKIIDSTFALEAKITKDNIGVSERTKGWNEACQAIYDNAPAIIEADKESEEKKTNEV